MDSNTTPYHSQQQQYLLPPQPMHLIHHQHIAHSQHSHQTKSTTQQIKNGHQNDKYYINESSRNNQNYKKSQKISKNSFKELFTYQENDSYYYRSKKQLKKDYKKIEENHSGSVKFKHLIDYYLTSSEAFGKALKNIDCQPFLESIDYESNEDSSSQINPELILSIMEIFDIIYLQRSSTVSVNNTDEEKDGNTSSEEEDRVISHLNEKVMRLICLNQGIDRYEKELSILKEEREKTIAKLQSKECSTKLHQILQSLSGEKIMEIPIINEHIPTVHSHQFQDPNVASTGSVNGQGGQELDRNLQQIDQRLQNMMQFMNDFALNFQSLSNQHQTSGQFRPSSQGGNFRPPSSGAGYRAAAQGMLTTQVWPKSRMLFAVVSKMSKEGLLNEQQRGVLKDMILDYDQRLLQCLQEYEAGGDRERLYYNFLQVSNQAN